jgi:threonine dehydrogenase-like Zn-dependent dehydrogenase
VNVRALVFTAPNQMDVLDVDEPSAGDGEVLVRVEAVGVCGSELHSISGSGWRQPPLVMGHEVVGTDPDGRRVAINPLVACRQCDSCLRGASNLCRTRELLGVQRPGGYAELVAAPRDSLHLVPDELGWAEAALIEPLANAVHASRLAGPLGGARVAIIGAGALGLLCTAVVGHANPSALTVADPSKGRLTVAERVGALEVTDRLHEEYDVIIDAVGASVTRVDSIERLRPGGTAIWLGLAQQEATLDGNAIVRSEKRVLGSFAYSDAEFGEAIRLSTLTDLGWTTSVALEESAAVFLDLVAGRSDIVRAVIRP